VLSLTALAATAPTSKGSSPRLGTSLPVPSLKEKKGSGSPASITSSNLKILERFVKKILRATAGNIKEQVPEVAMVSVKHINWLIVNKLNNRSRIATQKHLLTEKNKGQNTGLCQ
jgi:hypothetical protein